MSNQFDLSICIPTLNRKNALEKTLQALLTPDLPSNVQIVVSDNASTDETPIFLASLGLKYPNMNSVRQKEKVIFDSNVAFCVANASGKYIWVLPDDDLIDAKAISLVLEKLNSKNEPMGVFVNFGRFNEARLDFFQERVIEIVDDQIFELSELSSILIRSLSYAGSFICPREFWANSDNFVGTGFIHTGIALNSIAKIGSVNCIAQPLIRVQVGTQSWESSELEILVKGWSTMSRNLDSSYFSRSERTKIKNISLNNLIRTGWLISQRFENSLDFNIYIRKMLVNLGFKQNLLVFIIVLIPRSFLIFLRRLKHSLNI